MAIVYLGVGSNIEPERYISAGLDALHGLFGELALSSVYESAAVGFDGRPFLNLVARVETHLPLAALAATLRDLEVAHGRPPDATRFESRRLDIDILTYDQQVGCFGQVTLPRDEISYNAFVLCPLAELAPDERHPTLGLSYRALWDAYEQSRQRVWPVDFLWRGRVISRAP